MAKGIISSRAESIVTLNGQQAEAVLKSLQEKTKQLKKDLVEATKAGDIEALKSIEKELKAIEATLLVVQKITR